MVLEHSTHYKRAASHAACARHSEPTDSERLVVLCYMHVEKSAASFSSHHGRSGCSGGGDWLGNHQFCQKYRVSAESAVNEIRCAFEHKPLSGKCVIHISDLSAFGWLARSLSTSPTILLRCSLKQLGP